MVALIVSELILAASNIEGIRAVWSLVSQDYIGKLLLFGVQLCSSMV